MELPLEAFSPQAGTKKWDRNATFFLRPSKTQKRLPFSLGEALGFGAWIAACGRYFLFLRPKSFIFLNRVRLSIPRLSAVGPRFQLFFFKAFSR